jgi:Tol biopolymer transport system component
MQLFNGGVVKRLHRSCTDKGRASGRSGVLTTPRARCRAAAYVALTVITSVISVPLAADATVHGANGRIAYRVYANEAHTRGAIFTVNPDGTRKRQVTHPRPANLTTEPDWSPDGRWIVYTLYKHGNLDRSHLLKIHANGRHHVSLGRSCTRPCLADGFPTWAPHGRRIAFQRALGPSSGDDRVIALFSMRADGTHVRQITQRRADPRISQPYEDLAPNWSPKGNRIAFERHSRSTDHHAVFTVRLDGSGLRRLTPWRLDAAQPDYSPDGRWIVFRSQETSDTRGDIYLVTSHGTRLHQVTHEPAGTRKWGSVSFSPNGRRITASSAAVIDGETQLPDVYTFRVNGSARRDVTRTPHIWESAPDWGPQPR